ncbi:hypothetical protein GTW51_04170 [Aurantimonas aggregata]|uniref:Uncharacterized protein n=1 Tax=Aurantimonas aggregata TaxID=2047720 RepID=A0A6L9MDN7_9HYPH|nr:hypothetical protein [Aurantimonas aggregata]NDV85895.1 hypothetical protein [Aurantimonas aggregata]
MDLKTFDDRLLRYGPDIASWPPDESADAQFLVATDDAARARLEADQVLAVLVTRAARSIPDDAAILAGVQERIAGTSGSSRAAGLESILARRLTPAPVAAGALATMLIAVGLGYALATQPTGVPDDLLLAIAEGNFAGAELGRPGEALLWPGRS